jgi:hypothetical protein
MEIRGLGIKTNNVTPPAQLLRVAHTLRHMIYTGIVRSEPGFIDYGFLGLAYRNGAQQTTEEEEKLTNANDILKILGAEDDLGIFSRTTGKSMDAYCATALLSALSSLQRPVACILFLHPNNTLGTWTRAFGIAGCGATQFYFVDPVKSEIGATRCPEFHTQGFLGTLHPTEEAYYTAFFLEPIETTPKDKKEEDTSTKATKKRATKPKTKKSTTTQKEPAKKRRRRQPARQPDAPVEKKEEEEKK